MMIPVAFMTEHDQVALSLEPETLVRPVMHLQSFAVAAEIARVPGLFQGQPSHPLPMRRFQILGVWQPAEGRDRLLERAIDVESGHSHIAHG